MLRKNSEFGGMVNHGAGLPEWSHKNEKDWPPIHSGEQSIQITTLNDRFCYLTFSLRVLPALNLTTFDAGIVIFLPVRGLRPSR